MAAKHSAFVKHSAFDKHSAFVKLLGNAPGTFS